MGEKGVLGRGSSTFQSPGGYERVSCAGAHKATVLAATLTPRESIVFSVNLKAGNVSVQMISDINTHVMLLGSNASKSAPHRENTC